jgi:hypothetical protein
MRWTAPFNLPQTEGGTSYIWQPFDASFEKRAAQEKVVTFSNKFSQIKQSAGGLKKAFLSPFETTKKGVEKA